VFNKNNQKELVCVNTYNVVFSEDFMSTNPDTLAGLTIRDISLLIVLTAIAILFVVIAIGITVAIMNDPKAITIAGEFNLSEWNSAFLLIVGAGISMVSGSLATKAAILSRKNP
jgi:hypothetical protein